MKLGLARRRRGPARVATARAACTGDSPDRRRFQHHAAKSQHPRRVYKECGKLVARAPAAVTDQQGYHAVKAGGEIATIQPKAVAAACASGTTS